MTVGLLGYYFLRHSSIIERSTFDSFSVFFSAEEGEEGEEDSPLSYDKLIMPGKVSAINVSRNIPNLGSVIKASQREGSLNP